MEMVSVIIPVYNVEKYLEKCIKSVLAQTYHNIEIILIDDGSTDRSGALCEDYAALDERVKVIHKDNGGLSEARNTGIDLSKGDYICFIDSDDFVSVNYVNYLLELIKNNKADISVGGFFSVKANYTPKLSSAKDSVTVYTPLKALELLLYQKQINTSACAKLYKRSIWDNIRFPVGKLFEDINTIYKTFLKADKIICGSEIIYFYYLRSSSIVHSKFNIRKMDYVNNCDEVVSWMKRHYPYLYPAAVSRYLWANIHVWVNINDKKIFHNEFRQLTVNIRKYRSLVLKDSKVKWKNKIIIILTYFGWHATRRIYLLSRL